MDPLSDVLALLRPEGTLSACLDAGGSWSVRFAEAGDSLKCAALASGGCWLEVDGEEPVRLEAGDCFLLTHGRPFRLASDLRLPPQDAAAAVAEARDGIATLGTGGDAFLVSARFALAGPQAGLLLDLLPPLVHVRGGPSRGDGAALHWSIERLAEELRRPRPGGALVAGHLAHMVLVQALRRHLDEDARGPQGGVGWLFALADRRLAAALAALHANPGRRWTLQDLAGLAGMSRSTFALRFREAVGEPPMDYLARWRMALAADRLARTSESVAAVAWSLGYASETAFGTAFKRIMGHSPRRHGRTRAAKPPVARERQAHHVGAPDALHS